MVDSQDSPALPARVDGSLLSVKGLGKTFPKEGGGVLQALSGVEFALQPATTMALVGPDGAGKTTLLRVIAGLLPFDQGAVRVLGYDVAANPQAVQERISYMPQRFGLYEDLSVQENLDLYADVHGVAGPEREKRYAELLAMTDLERFRGRLAGKLSGGMKQKLGLACTLVRLPKLLLLDEPTVGVDPLSRRELWQIIQRCAIESGLAVLMSTAYMDEAARCDHVLLLHEGVMLAQGNPAELRALTEGQSYRVTPVAGDNARRLQGRLLAVPGIIDAVPQGGAVRFVHPMEGAGQGALEAALRGASPLPVPANLEDSFMALLRARFTPATPAQGTAPAAKAAVATTPAASFAPLDAGAPVIEVQDVTRRFGDFVAVNNVSFSVQRGEVFGLLGPNGAGKTTTFRMLCGLLAASSGTLRVAGVDVRHAPESARQRLGYVAQKFSLYAPLTVRENLEFFAGAYGLKGARQTERIAHVAQEFALQGSMHMPAGFLPGGYKQRLSMAVAMLHEPEILFLDEPTSGADPLARREFWQRISTLAENGTTIIITTHFMEEAEYCDRILIQDNGNRLALDTPEKIRAGGIPPGGDSVSFSMEDAFIAVVEQARRDEAPGRELQ